MTKQIMVTIKGKTLSLRGWSAQSGVAVATLRDRRRRNIRGDAWLEPPLPGIAKGRMAAQSNAKPAGWDEMVKESLREFPWLSHDSIDTYFWNAKAGRSGGDSHKNSDNDTTIGGLRY